MLRGRRPLPEFGVFWIGVCVGVIVTLLGLVLVLMELTDD